MRRLTLHASALNNEEYDLYTTSIVDLALCESNRHDENTTRDDAFYEEITVSVREVRAWLRGRYPNIPTENIDAILKFFSPVLAQGDVLTGGQFFAILRLVVHAQNGREVDRGLAFVQAHPASSAHLLANAKLTSEYTPPQLPKRSDGYAASSTSDTTATPLANPFSYDSRQQPPLHPSQRQESSRSVHSPNNPFVSRSKSISEDGSGRLPPLPPRKTQNAPPPRHAPISSSASAPTHPQAVSSTIPNISRAPPSITPQPLSHSHPPPPPPPPPKPKSKPTTHVTSTLIKQSLQASKTAQTMKKAEEQLEKERVLQVLRSSAVVTGSNMRGSGSGSRSPSKRIPASQQSVVAKSDSSASWSGGEERERERPPLPRRRRYQQQQQQQQPSPPMSTSSLEQVALAVAPSGTRSHPHTPFTSSPFESPNNSPRTRPTLDLPGVVSLPPPTHPDRKPYGFSYQMPSTMPDEHSPSSSLSPFRRNLESFEAVYGTGSTTSSLSTATPSTPTATSDLTSSPGSPQQRVHRSKSLHHHPPLPHTPPPPPARRRRPESVQVLSNGEVLFGGNSPTKSPLYDTNNALKNAITQTPHRRSSYSASLGSGASSSSIFGGGSGSAGGNGGGADALQRKFAELQLKAENALPKLEAARYKAEAGLSRRGFIQGSSHGKAEKRSRSRIGVKEDRRGLMSGYCEDQYGGGAGEDGEIDGLRSGGGLSVDSDNEEHTRERGERGVVERDELKWPAGEGWSRML